MVSLTCCWAMCQRVAIVSSQAKHIYSQIHTHTHTRTHAHAHTHRYTHTPTHTHRGRCFAQSGVVVIPLVWFLDLQAWRQPLCDGVCVSRVRPPTYYRWSDRINHKLRTDFFYGDCMDRSANRCMWPYKCSGLERPTSKSNQLLH